MSLGILIGTAVVFTIIGLFFRGKITPEKFIANRNSLGLWTAVATIFASAMGAWILFGPVETMITGGIWALLGYAISSGLSLWMFIWLGPKLRNRMPKGHTITEYVYHRHGKVFCAIVLLISLAYMALALTAELTGIAQAGQVVFGVQPFYVALIIGVGVLIYTALGGFQASVATDKVQTWVIVPILLVVFIATLIFSKIGEATETAAKSGLFGYSVSGIELGITLIIAIVGAELFNQSWWQRVWAAKNDVIMKKAYFLSGVIVMPIVYFVGYFGVLALHEGVADNPSTAFFTFIATLPHLITIIALILAVGLVMSSLDSLLNGMVAIFTVHLSEMDLNKRALLPIGRVISLLLIGGAVVVATKGLSVLYLFLLADLIALSAAFPVFYALFNKKYSGTVATFSTILALFVGLIFFPNFTWSGSVLLGAKVAGTSTNMLISFVLAAIIPVILSPLSRISNRRGFDERKLKAVKSL